VYLYVSKIFKNKDLLYEQSINLAKHLYEQSTHPKIKGGEFYTVYFKDCILGGETLDAIGLFKSENKDTFLKVIRQNGNFNLESQKGINIKKLDTNHRNHHLQCNVHDDFYTPYIAICNYRNFDNNRLQ